MEKNNQMNFPIHKGLDKPVTFAQTGQCTCCSHAPYRNESHHKEKVALTLKAPSKISSRQQSKKFFLIFQRKVLTFHVNHLPSR